MTNKKESCLPPRKWGVEKRTSPFNACAAGDGDSELIDEGFGVFFSEMINEI